MKLVLAVFVLAFATSSVRAEKIIAVRGPAPALPVEAKWIGTKKLPRIDDMRGSVILVHFWHEGSDPCRNNFGFFGGWMERFGVKGALKIVGIHGPDTVDNPENADIEKTATKMSKIFPTAIEETDLTMKAWKVGQVPTLFLIDKKGQLRYSWEGQMNFRRLHGDLMVEEKIVELMNEK